MYNCVMHSVWSVLARTPVHFVRMHVKWCIEMPDRVPRTGDERAGDDPNLGLEPDTGFEGPMSQLYLLRADLGFQANIQLRQVYI